MFRQLRQRQRLVEMPGAPGEHLFGEFQTRRQIGGVVRDVAQLVWILGEIEQQWQQAAAEMDIFEVVRAQDGQVAIA